MKYLFKKSLGNKIAWSVHSLSANLAKLLLLKGYVEPLEDGNSAKVSKPKGSKPKK